MNEIKLWRYSLGAATADGIRRHILEYLPRLAEAIRAELAAERSAA